MGITGSSFSRDHGFAGSGRHKSPISLKPFTSIDLENEDDTLDWVKMASCELADFYDSYRSLYNENIDMYIGGTLDDATRWNGQNLIRSRSGSTCTANLIRPIVESHVSRLTSSRTNVSVLPVNTSEYQDLSAAKNSEALIKMSFDQQKLDGKFENAGRCALVCGASYMCIDWDPDIGPPSPVVDQPVAALNEEGEPQLDEDGLPILIRPNLRIGDVSYKVLRADQVLEQPGEWGRTVDWVITLEMVDIYRLREMYPTKGEAIKPSCDDSQKYSMAKTAEQQALVYTIYHRATKGVPNGRRIICTDDVILENDDLPYPTLNRYGILPIARMEDMCVPGYDLPLPLTVMETAKPYQSIQDRLNKNIIRNLSLQTPKWIVNSQGGVRLAHLNNASNIVQYKGSPDMAPRMETPRTTANEVFNYRATLQGEMEQVTGVQHILNSPPPNTRAAVMLQHQEEQEFKRSEPLIKKMNNFQAEVAKIALAIMADKYDDSDERMIKLGGGLGSGKFLRLSVADLIGPFDIRFERTSALPESKQGRLNEASRMYQLGIIDDATYKKLINFSADPDLATPETKAYEKQLAENDLMIRGETVTPPLEFEDHVEHLRAMYPLIQSLEFAEMPDQIRLSIMNHAMAHEMLAWKRAQVSTAYAIKVAEHVQFGFFTALPEAIPVGANNPPTPLDGLIQQRLMTPGLMKPSNNLLAPPGPGNPEAI